MVNNNFFVGDRSLKSHISEDRLKDNSQDKLQEEDLSGTVERITYHAEDSGFCVLQVNIKGQRDLVTLTGSIPIINVGECIEARGLWATHGKYGLQFKANFLNILEPTTLSGIEKYLASGMVKGVGPVYAKKLIRHFGENVLNVIDEQPERLLEISGFGPKKVEMIAASWTEQRQVRKIMVFLQSYGVGTARATRIYKKYGDKAIEQIKADPYCLARDIWGVGFKTADQLALKMGLDPCSEQRARAGLYFALQEHTNSGHCACARDDLLQQAEKLLQISAEILKNALDMAISKEEIVQLPFDDGKNAVALDKIYTAEQQVAIRLTGILNSTLPKFSDMKLSEIEVWIQKN